MRLLVSLVPVAQAAAIVGPLFPACAKELGSETGVTSDLFGRMKGTTSNQCKYECLSLAHSVTQSINQTRREWPEWSAGPAGPAGTSTAKRGTIPPAIRASLIPLISSSYLLTLPRPNPECLPPYLYLALLTGKKCPERIQCSTGLHVQYHNGTQNNCRVYRWRGLRNN